MTSAVIRLGAYFSRRPEGIVYVSQASQSQHQALGYSNANTFVVANGFDTALFRPSTELRAEVRAELGVPDSVILIGMIGRYHPSKDHLNFLRAAALLQNQGDIRFVLCGRGVDPDNSSIKTTSGELGISERLLLLGERHDIPRLMTGLDVLVSSSSNEAFPNVIGEAMSCGVPCVATDVGDVRSLLGGTGNITPPRDPQALAQGLSRLIDSGHEGRKLLGHAARSRIVDRFSIEAVARQYESLYEKTAAGQLDGKQSEMD